MKKNNDKLYSKHQHRQEHELRTSTLVREPYNRRAILTDPVIRYRKSIKPTSHYCDMIAKRDRRYVGT